MKSFNDLRDKYNVEFYSISFDEDISRISKFTKKNKKYTWPIVFAGRRSALWDYFRVRQIPAYYILNNKGIVISKVFRNELEAELKIITTSNNGEHP